MKSTAYGMFNHDYSFVRLKSLLAPPDFSKAGARGAGLDCPTEVLREAARFRFASLTGGSTCTIGLCQRRRRRVDSRHGGEIRHRRQPVPRHIVLDTADNSKIFCWRRSAERRVIGKHRPLNWPSPVLWRPRCKMWTCTISCWPPDKITPFAGAAPHDDGTTRSLSSRLQPNHPVDV